MAHFLPLRQREPLREREEVYLAAAETVEKVLFVGFVEPRGVGPHRRKVERPNLCRVLCYAYVPKCDIS